MQTSKKEYSLTEAIKKLEYYCSYQDRCTSQVASKLKEMKISLEAIDTITATLIKNDFLDDERFACNFARGKFRIKKWGKVRISRELRLRSISQSGVKKALDQIEDTLYLKTFDDLAQHKWKQIREKNIQKKKRKLADYLLYRGWESHIVYDKVHALAIL